MQSSSVTLPELLVPAGSIEKLKVAVRYGADAVYLGGQRYGLRAMADNFTETELRRAVAFAHAHNVKVYITLNAFLHDDDLAGLPEYAKFLEEIGVDAAIVSDAGVLRVIRSASSIPIHLSTQASCLNTHSAKFWKSIGVRRVIVGRELSIEEGGAISREAQIEVEMFIHGAMCMAFSGNCTISNFTAGRDSNRGGCIQSCRFKYSHQTRSQATHPSLALAETASSCGSTSYFMSSRDQMGVRLIPEFIRHGICSLKIEGRMKSVLYAATLCSAYRKALDAYANGTLNEALLATAEQELKTVPHREYFEGNFVERAGPDSTYQHDGTSATHGSHKYLGLVIDADEERVALRLSQPLTAGRRIEFLPFTGNAIDYTVRDMKTLAGDELSSVTQDSVVTLPRGTVLAPIKPYTVARIAEATL